MRCVTNLQGRRRGPAVSPGEREALLPVDARPDLDVRSGSGETCSRCCGPKSQGRTVTTSVRSGSQSVSRRRSRMRSHPMPASATRTIHTSGVDTVNRLACRSQEAACSGQSMTSRTSKLRARRWSSSRCAASRAVRSRGWPRTRDLSDSRGGVLVLEFPHRAVRRAERGRCAVGALQGVPGGVVLRKACSAGAVAGRDGGGLIGEEDPVGDVASVGEGTSCCAAVQAAIDPTTAVSAECSWFGTPVWASIGAEKRVWPCIGWHLRVSWRRGRQGRGKISVRSGSQRRRVGRGLLTSLARTQRVGLGW